MDFDSKILNRILTDHEYTGKITPAELDFLESALLSGALRGLSRQGLPLFGIRPKTRLFESNFYRLETVRVLTLHGRKAHLQAYIDAILQELRGKCYGNFCPSGECYETSVCVLRFLRVVCPEERDWIACMEAGIRMHRGDKVRTKAVQQYIARAL